MTRILYVDEGLKSFILTISCPLATVSFAASSTGFPPYPILLCVRMYPSIGPLHFSLGGGCKGDGNSV